MLTDFERGRIVGLQKQCISQRVVLRHMDRKKIDWPTKENFTHVE